MLNREENALMNNTIEILDQEKETILSDVLKCSICLEMPKGKVQVCVEGHHFCLSCHNKMDTCGICRGTLLDTRNFAVETLITKLGVIFGLSEDLPPADKPFNLTSGSYNCLHGCKCKMPSHQMLPHIRAKHPDNLLDKVRSNPYSGQFSFKHSIKFTRDKKGICSAHVSDMGLFTFEFTFFDLDFFGCVRMLVDKKTSHPFVYQLVVKTPNAGFGSFEIGVSDCPVSSYFDDVKSLRREGRGLSIKGETLTEHIDLGEEIIVIFSIRKKAQGVDSESSIFYIPKVQVHFKSDRKARRNRNRNRRRKKTNRDLQEGNRGIIWCPPL